MPDSSFIIGLGASTKVCRHSVARHSWRRRVLTAFACFSLMSVGMELQSSPVCFQERQQAPRNSIEIERHDDLVRVYVRKNVADPAETEQKEVESTQQQSSGQELFTEYRFREFAKPVFYPVYGKDQLSMVRHFPMEDGHEHEQHDHAHHKGIWFAHGDVNGIDFWTERGTIRLSSLELLSNGFKARHTWSKEETKIACDETVVKFLTSESGGNSWRAIDYSVKLLASHGRIVLGDTKEGTFAIRTAPEFRLERPDGLPAGTAFNSQGVTGKAIWGKQAEWVCYQAALGSDQWSIVIFDHPKNLRHPTTWHARAYGLAAANPFGLHDFQRLANKSAGNYVVNRDESLSFRYRILFYEGALKADQIREHYRSFCE